MGTSVMHSTVVCRVIFGFIEPCSDHHPGHIDPGYIGHEITRSSLMEFANEIVSSSIGPYFFFVDHSWCRYDRGNGIWARAYCIHCVFSDYRNRHPTTRRREHASFFLMNWRSLKEAWHNCWGCASSTTTSTILHLLWANTNICSLGTSTSSMQLCASQRKVWLRRCVLCVLLYTMHI